MNGGLSQEARALAHVEKTSGHERRMTQEHTPEPWTADGFTIKRLGTKQVIAGLPIDDFDYAANARRIVACVNALAGISTEAIEGGVIAELGEAGKRIQAHNLCGDFTVHTGECAIAFGAFQEALAKLEASK